MNRNAKIVAGVASAVVGTACLVALVKAVSQPASPKKSKRKGKKSKRSKKDKSKSSSQGTTRELVFKIERECIAEFKAYLPKLGEKEASLFQQVQAGGRQLTQEVAEQIQGTLIQELETHLEKFKKALCEKYSCSESKHDKLVQKLLEDKDPEIMKLMEESQKLWAIFKPREAASMEVPEHIDEDAAIAYITRSFKLVTAAMAESRKQFVKDDTPEARAAFRDSMKSDQQLAAKFNESFRRLLEVSKKELMAEFNLPGEEVVGAMVAKFQSSPKFSAAVGKAKQEMDAFFQTV